MFKKNIEANFIFLVYVEPNNAGHLYMHALFILREFLLFIYSSSPPCRTQPGVPCVEKGNSMNQIQAVIRWWSVLSAHKLPIVSVLR